MLLISKEIEKKSSSQIHIHQHRLVRGCSGGPHTVLKDFKVPFTRENKPQQHGTSLLLNPKINLKNVV